MATREPSPFVLAGARRLVAEVWALVQDKTLDARSPAGDAALDLRDLIDPEWWPDTAEERAATGYRYARGGQPWCPNTKPCEVCNDGTVHETTGQAMAAHR